MGAGASASLTASQQSLDQYTPEGKKQTDAEEEVVSDEELEGVFLKLKETFDEQCKDLKRRRNRALQPTKLFAKVFARHFKLTAIEEGGIDLECAWHEVEHDAADTTKADAKQDNNGAAPASTSIPRKNREVSTMRMALVQKVGDQAVYAPKVVRLLGDAAVAGPKALKPCVGAAAAAAAAAVAVAVREEEKEREEAAGAPPPGPPAAATAALGEDPDAEAERLCAEALDEMLGPEMTPEELLRRRSAESKEMLQERKEAEREVARVAADPARPAPAAGLAPPPGAGGGAGGGAGAAAVPRKALDFFSDEELDAEVRRRSAAAARPGGKAARLAGEAVVAGAAAYKVLGDGMAPEQARAMRAAEDMERQLSQQSLERSQAELLSRARAEEEQRRLEAGRDAPVADKALELMGEEELEEMAKKLVPLGLRSEKAAQLTGESVVAGRKVHQWLGSGMDQAMIDAMHEADKKMAEEQEEAMQEGIKKLLRQGVSPDQIKLAQNALYGVGDKALKLMGSEELAEEAKHLIPKGTKSNKMAKLTGETGMAGSKVRQRMGSVMNDEQVRAMARQAEREAQASQQASRAALEAALAQDLAHGAEGAGVERGAMVNEKVLKMMDDERLTEGAKKIIPKNVKSEKLAKMAGESQMAGDKVFSRMGTGMTEEQLRALREAEAREAREEQARRDKELREVLSAGPSDSQLEIDEQHKPNKKALDKLGGEEDELLMGFMTPNTKGSPGFKTNKHKKKS